MALFSATTFQHNANMTKNSRLILRKYRFKVKNCGKKIKFQMKSERFVVGSKHGNKTIDKPEIIRTFV